MSNCIRCHKSIDMDNVKYCPFCGAVQQRKQGTRQRGNGTGTAEKQGNTWTAKLIIGWKLGQDGVERPIRRCKRGFKTKKDALAYIPMLKGKKQITANLQHYWQIWSNDDMLSLSHSKQLAYKIAYKKLGNLVYMNISDITVQDLKRVVSEKCSTYYTARDAKAVLRKLYALADADGIGNPRLPSYINLPKLNERQGEAFTEQQIGKIWTAYNDGTIDAGYVLIMIYTGMMPGQLIGLRKSCIDFESKQIVGAGMKTKVRKSTPISIAQLIAPVLQELAGRTEGDRFVPYSRDHFYRIYHDTLQIAGVRDLPPYSCRHTTATALAVGQSVAPEVIRKVMRWSTTKMLSRYAHPDVSDALEAVNRITKNNGY